jgi:peptidoglycan-N-acetylglucosamine deacetylase
MSRLRRLLVVAAACAICGWGAAAAGAAPAGPVFRTYGHAGVTGVVEHARHEVALTFDDCGDVGAWRSIVKTLHHRGRHAAFFCIGEAVDAHPGLARRLVSQGDMLCNHSWSHPDLTTLSARDIRRQLHRTRNLIYHDTGSTCRYLRPPYGAYDREVLRIAGGLGYRRALLWSVDPRDWERPGSGAIVSRVLSDARSGSIVLLHVLPETARALPDILRGLHEKGLSVTVLSRMIHDGDPSPGGWPSYREL